MPKTEGYMKKRALIDVCDKSCILDFSQQLITLGFEIIALGTSYDYLKENGVEVLSAFDVTTSVSYLNGSLDAINTKIHMGISSNRSNAEDILQMKTITNKAQIDDDEEIEEEASEYKSILDFPNFIMHVFKLKYQTEQIDISLNEKDLLSVYDQIKKKIDSKDFLKALFFCRVVFDKFIIKTISDKNAEDEIKWILHKPTKYEKSWKYTNSFGDSHEQYRIVKALSMLQVTFRTRIYKNWLYDILKWFYEEKKNISVEAKEYINKLDELILQYYKEREIQYNRILQEKESVSKDNTYSLGTDTPHFIFNFIDYLYWVDSKNSCPINKVCKIEDFEFKYWNSVEHHMAREWAERNNIANREKFIDCLGNLCLISKGVNSRLSDRDVKEKVQTFGKGNLGMDRKASDGFVPPSADTLSDFERFHPSKH